MTTKFCDVCGGFMEKVEMTIGGHTDEYWVCEDCGFEQPASIAQQTDELAEQPAAEQAD